MYFLQLSGPFLPPPPPRSTLQNFPLASWWFSWTRVAKLQLPGSPLSPESHVLLRKFSRIPGWPRAGRAVQPQHGHTHSRSAQSNQHRLPPPPQYPEQEPGSDPLLCSFEGTLCSSFLLRREAQNNLLQAEFHWASSWFCLPAPSLTLQCKFNATEPAFCHPKLSIQMLPCADLTVVCAVFSWYLSERIRFSILLQMISVLILYRTFITPISLCRPTQLIPIYSCNSSCSFQISLKVRNAFKNCHYKIMTKN